MTLITLRPIAKRPPERSAPPRSIHPLEDAPHTPISGNLLRGQRTYLSGRSPLRCYYYNKTARGRWSSAERSVSGMRWNAYLSSGRATPKFEPLRTERLPRVVKGLMKEIEARSASAGIIAPEGTRIARAKAAASRTGIGSVPEAAKESNVVRISTHPGFRHLRAVRDGKEETATRTDERKVTEIRARMEKKVVTLDAETRTQHRSEPGPEIRTGYQREERRSIAHANVRLLFIAPAAHSSSRQEMPSENAAEIVRQGSSPRAVEKIGESRRLDGWKGTDITIRLPGFLAAGPMNDNAQGPEPIVPAVAVSCGGQAASPGCDTVSLRRGIGYFSSGRRRSFQLKIAMGAAALPQ